MPIVPLVKGAAWLRPAAALGLHCSGLLAVAGLLCGCLEGGVVRVVDGAPTVGRRISAHAYATYARAATAEAFGDLRGALAGFEAAATADPESPEAWTRIGSLRCRLGVGSASEAFGRAESLDTTYAPAFRERARCNLDRESRVLTESRARSFALLDSARAAADHALELDPFDVETSFLRAEVLFRSGDVDASLRVLRALVAHYPRSAEAWKHLCAFAERSGRPALAREAADRLQALPSGLPPEKSPLMPSLAPLAKVDTALRDGDVDRARRAALAARLTVGELALRAAALGKSAFAREEASQVLGADDADAAARVALTVAADLGNDVEALGAAMRSLPRKSTGLSPLGSLLFAEVLARRVGVDAARSWLVASGAPAVDGHDPLLAETDRRVRVRLAGP